MKKQNDEKPGCLKATRLIRRRDAWVGRVMMEDEDAAKKQHPGMK